MHTHFVLLVKSDKLEATLWQGFDMKITAKFRFADTHIDLTVTLNHSIWQFNLSSLVFIWKYPPPMEASASLPSSVLQLCCHSLLSSLNSVSVIVRPGWSLWLLPSAMFSAPVVIRSFSDAKPISLFPCWAHLNREPGRENTQSMVTIKRGIK